MNDITVERTGDTTNRFVFQTLGSETLVKTLFDAIEYEWSNNALRVIIKELSRKGYNCQRLVHIVEDKLGKLAALKIIRIIFKQ